MTNKPKIILRNKLIINLKHYQYNLKVLKKKVQKDLLVVIKANAYGMGYEKIVQVLKANQVSQVAISCLQEAYEVRKIFDGEIHLLGDFLQDEISHLIDLDVLIPLTNFNSAKLVSTLARKKKKSAKVQIYLDTGMGNLGLNHQNALPEIEKIFNLSHLEVKGIFSHFSNADKKKDALTKSQLQRFDFLINNLQKKITTKKIKLHLANSDAIMNYPQSYLHFVRTGIALYGVTRRYLDFGLKPCLAFKSHLISKRLLTPPFTVGYAKTFAIKKPTWVGTVSAGYADGLPFALSNQGRVLINGLEFPIIGRLSMDYLTVDLLDQEKHIKIGDEVTLLGEDKKSQQTILVEEWSNHKKTHPYDILCSFGSRRLDKIYIE